MWVPPVPIWGVECAASLTSKPVGISGDLLPVISSGVFVGDTIAPSHVSVDTSDPCCPPAEDQLTDCQSCTDTNQ